MSRAERYYDGILDGDGCKMEFEEVVGHAESDVSHDGYPPRQHLPLHEQTMDDIDEFLGSCQGLTYIFLVSGAEQSDQVTSVYPGVMVALPLVDAALHDTAYDPPYAPGEP